MDPFLEGFTCVYVFIVLSDLVFSINWCDLSAPFNMTQTRGLSDKERLEPVKKSLGELQMVFANQVVSHAD